MCSHYMRREGAIISESPNPRYVSEFVVEPLALRLRTGPEQKARRKERSTRTTSATHAYGERGLAADNVHHRARSRAHDASRRTA